MLLYFYFYINWRVQINLESSEKIYKELSRVHHNIHFQFPQLPSRLILHEGRNGFLRYGNAVVLGVLLSDGPWVHIQSTYSSHDQIYEFYELMGIHAYMNKQLFIHAWIPSCNEYVDCWSCMKILLIIYDNIHIHVMKKCITPTLGGWRTWTQPPRSSSWGCGVRRLLSCTHPWFRPKQCQCRQVCPPCWPWWRCIRCQKEQLLLQMMASPDLHTRCWEGH